MSEVVRTDSGPKVEIKIEETAIAGGSTVPASHLEGNADVNNEDAMGN